MAHELGSDRTELEIRQEILQEFMNRLWRFSIAGNHGKSKAYLWPLRTNNEINNPKPLNTRSVPTVEVEIKPQAERSLAQWQEITRRLFVTPTSDKSRIGLSFYEEGLGGVNTVNIPLDSSGHTLPLTYSNIKGVADLETDLRTIGLFPSRPDAGRPNVRFRVIEMFTDSRKDLLKRYSNKNLSKAQQKAADTDLLDFLKRSEMAQTPALKDEWKRLRSTPLSVIELIGRTTYWDKSRENGVPQPINFAGIKITETLAGEVVVDKLIPWVGHETWEEMPREIQRNFPIEWESNFNLLDQNLTTLVKAFK